MAPEQYYDDLRGEMDLRGLFVARQPGLIPLNARQSNTGSMTDRVDQAVPRHPLEDVVALDSPLVFLTASEIRTSRTAPPATGRGKAPLSHLKKGRYSARKDRTEPLPLTLDALPLTIPVIDLFAGPGGLGEGFAASRPPSGPPRFRVALSIENDLVARETLRLRTFYREFAPAGARYYDCPRGEMDLKGSFYGFFPVEAGADDRISICLAIQTEPTSIWISSKKRVESQLYAAHAFPSPQLNREVRTVKKCRERSTRTN